MYYTEEQLKKYSEPLSTTEQEKCERAIRMISKALIGKGFKESSKVTRFEDTNSYSTNLEKDGLKVKLLTQGSFANNTNIKGESDVDIAVIKEDTFIPKYPKGKTSADFGNVSSEPIKYKKIILKLLEENFNSDEIIIGEKSIKLKDNSSRVNADIVPAKRYRNYTEPDVSNGTPYTKGISIDTLSSTSIINYPEQHIIEGRDKNISTTHYFKKIVRIFKNIKNDMSNSKISIADKIGSFQLESLLWNVPDELYLKGSTYREKCAEIIKYLMSEISLDTAKEANAINYLVTSEKDKEQLETFTRELLFFFMDGNPL